MAKLVPFPEENKDEFLIFKMGPEEGDTTGISSITSSGGFPWGRRGGGSGQTDLEGKEVHSDLFKREFILRNHGIQEQGDGRSPTGQAGNRSPLGLWAAPPRHLGPGQGPTERSRMQSPKSPPTAPQMSHSGANESIC